MHFGHGDHLNRSVSVRSSLYQPQGSQANRVGGPLPKRSFPPPTCDRSRGSRRVPGRRAGSTRLCAGGQFRPVRAAIRSSATAALRSSSQWTWCPALRCAALVRWRLIAPPRRQLNARRSVVAAMETRRRLAPPIRLRRLQRARPPQISRDTTADCPDATAVYRHDPWPRRASRGRPRRP